MIWTGEIIITMLVKFKCFFIYIYLIDFCISGMWMCTLMHRTWQEDRWVGTPINVSELVLESCACFRSGLNSCDISRIPSEVDAINVFCVDQYFLLHIIHENDWGLKVKSSGYISCFYRVFHPKVLPPVEEEPPRPKKWRYWLRRSMLGILWIHCRLWEVSELWRGVSNDYCCILFFYFWFK